MCRLKELHRAPLVVFYTLLERDVFFYVYFTLKSFLLYSVFILFIFFSPPANARLSSIITNKFPIRGAFHTSLSSPACGGARAARTAGRPIDERTVLNI